MAFVSARRALLAAGALSLVLLAYGAPGVSAQTPDFSVFPGFQERSVYVELTVTSPTPTYQSPSLSSPQVGSLAAGETITASPGVVIGDSGVAFVRCRRVSGEDLGYCPVSGVNSVITNAPITTSGLISGVVAPVCNAFGQCFVITDRDTVVEPMEPRVTVEFDR
jgi:hypothetical protein